MPRRLVALAFLAAAGAAVARLLADARVGPATRTGNGHSHDPGERAALRRSIAAARGRVRGGLDQLRGSD